MNRYKNIRLLIIICAIAGCKDNALDMRADISNADINSLSTETATLEPASYVQWVENPDNGLRVNKNIGKFQFDLQYKPLEYTVLKESKNPTITREELNQQSLEFGELQHFTFKIGIENIQDEPLKVLAAEHSDYEKLVEYFSFKMQNDLKLVEGNDTLSCKLHHFERTYSVAPYLSFVIAFEESKHPEADKTFIFDDSMIGTGPVKITLSSKKFKQIPTLITKDNARANQK